MYWLELIPDIWLQIAIASAWLGAVSLVAATINRYTSANSEIRRKVVHIGTGNVILLAWWLHIPAWVGITASILRVLSPYCLINYLFCLVLIVSVVKPGDILLRC